MIALIVEQRCNHCDLCIEVCPANVFAPTEAGAPVIARPDECTTCFMCELYCRQDALYVDPDCEAPTAVDAADVVASGQLGRYRRDAGWDRMERSVSERTAFDGTRVSPGPSGSRFDRATIPAGFHESANRPRAASGGGKL